MNIGDRATRHLPPGAEYLMLTTRTFRLLRNGSAVQNPFPLVSSLPDAHRPFPLEAGCSLLGHRHGAFHTGNPQKMFMNEPNGRARSLLAGWLEECDKCHTIVKRAVE